LSKCIDNDVVYTGDICARFNSITKKIFPNQCSSYIISVELIRFMLTTKHAEVCSTLSTILILADI
jgi:hypothetical protein